MKCFLTKNVCVAKSQNLILEFRFLNGCSELEIVNKYLFYESSLLQKNLEFQISASFFAVLNPNIQGYNLFVYQREVLRNSKNEILPRPLYGAIRQNEGQKFIKFAIKTMQSEPEQQTPVNPLHFNSERDSSLK